MSDFIIIDDDPINNLICTRLIRIIYPDAMVHSYINPLTALTEIRGKYAVAGDGDIVVFLDINMPEISGWDVLDVFHTFPETEKKHFKIFILSSSVDALDKQKADKNPYVSGYIPKPLSRAILTDILQ